MQRHELIDQLRQLKLHGMATAFDEAVIQGVRRQLTVQEILAQLCQAEVAERKARSIRYQLGIARFPVAKDLDSFRFAGSPVNEMLIRDLYGSDFLGQTRNLIFIGGTGTGKTHLAIAIAAQCVKRGYRARFFSVVDLVNQLGGKVVAAAFMIELEGLPGRKVLSDHHVDDVLTLMKFHD